VLIIVAAVVGLAVVAVIAVIALGALGDEAEPEFVPVGDGQAAPPTTDRREGRPTADVTVELERLCAGEIERAGLADPYGVEGPPYPLFVRTMVADEAAYLSGNPGGELPAEWTTRTADGQPVQFTQLALCIDVTLGDTVLWCDGDHAPLPAGATDADYTAVDTTFTLHLLVAQTGEEIDTTEVTSESTCEEIGEDSGSAGDLPLTERIADADVQAFVEPWVTGAEAP
jgi:hypothetical protein